MSMDGAEQLLRRLSELGIRLGHESGHLRFSAPAGVLTPDLRAELSRHKAELLLLLRASEARRSAAITPISRSTHPGVQPVSFVQERLWILHALEGESGAYNVAEGWRLRGSLDAATLEQSLTAIASRHEILRTRYRLEEERLVQEVEAGPVPILARVDLSGFPPAQREIRWHEEAARAWHVPFDLDRAPLWRAMLVKLAAEDYALLMTWHHSLYDSWSAQVFATELSLLYEAGGAGRAAALPTLPIQYGDFASWQRQYIQGPLLAQQLAYWRDVLSGHRTMIQLPVDHPRGPRQTYRGSHRNARFPASLRADLHALSRQCGVTLFITTLAAFKTLLSRYARQADVTVGSPIANRDRPEVQQLIGCFLNTLVLRTDLSGDPSFREVLRRVRQTTLGAFDHQDVPFEKLVAEHQPQRDLSRHPLFQILFILETRREESLRLPGIQVERLHPPSWVSPFDLSLQLLDAGDGIEATAEFNADLFRAETIDGLLARFEVLLQAIVREPDRPISVLPLLTEAEQHELMVVRNATATHYAQQATLPELITQQVARSPQASAVRFEDQVLTYRELDERSRSWAAQLEDAGAGPGALVGVCLRRSAEMVTALLAVLRTGAAYVPLDPAYPAERLAHMIDDSGMRLILTEESVRSRLPRSTVCSLCLEQLGRPASPRAKQRPTPSAEDLAYVIYTSGSTGKAKGVQITHRSLVNFLVSMRDQLGLQPLDVVLGLTTLSFDIAGLELWLPLTTGAQVAIVPTDVAADAQRLDAYIRRYAVTVMQATPVTWRMLLEGGWGGENHLKVLCGGEAWDQDLARQLLKRCRQLWNVYGPTETTIWSTIREIRDGELVTLGHPIANTQLYVLDDHLQPVPTGVAGELFIGGDGVSCGYLNRPDLTSERFLANPFVHQPGARMYRTGDLVRYNGEGELEYLGRTDYQVKIRGFRIELGEIDAILSRHPRIREAVTVVREDSPGERRLVAYFASQSGVTLTANALREHLRSALPEYMVPYTLVPLDELPKTPNGKIDRGQLPRPDTEAGDGRSRFEPPATATEERLARMWMATLNVSRVGRQDNFFDLGGHSLLAVKLFARIEREFNQRLPLATLFAAPTLAGLATELQTQASSSAAWRPLVVVQPKGNRIPFFCVHGAGGNVLLYRELSRRLGTDYPFFGLQCEGLDGHRPHLKRIEDMAARYLPEIFAQRPRGPYCLGGYCMGGLVAYELAQQLRSREEDVALLALFDTYNQATLAVTPSLTSRTQFLFQKVGFHWANLLGVGMDGRRLYMREKLRMAREAVAARSGARWRQVEAMLAGRVPHHAPPASLEKANDQAAAAYRPKPYRGVVTLFKPQQNYSSFSDPQQGWGELAQGGLRMIELPVNPHAMLVEPYVEKLADQLRPLIDEASQRPALSLDSHPPAS